MNFPRAFPIARREIARFETDIGEVSLECITTRTPRRRGETDRGDRVDYCLSADDGGAFGLDEETARRIQRGDVDALRRACAYLAAGRRALASIGGKAQALATWGLQERDPKPAATSVEERARLASSRADERTKPNETNGGRDGEESKAGEESDVDGE